MKLKQKIKAKPTLSDKIADALTVKPRADIEDDQVFGTKPQTVSRADFSSSDSEDDATISDFRKRNVNLLSEISKKYEGQVVSRQEWEKPEPEEDLEESDSDDDHNLLTVQDLLLNEDSESSEDESNFSKSSKLETSPKNKDLSKNGDCYATSRKVKASAIKRDSKVSAIDTSNESSDEDGTVADNNSINKNLKSIHNSPEDHQVSSETEENPDSENASSDDNEDDSISGFRQELNKSTEKKELKKPKKSVSSDSEDGSSEIESEDYSIHRKDDNESDGEEESESGGEEDEGYDISQMETPAVEDFEHVRKQNISEEAKKGACVRNQLLIWESLLEMRIHLQRCVNTANQMPVHETHEKLMGNSQFSEECTATKTNITNVLDKFLVLQSLLLKNNPETKSLSSKKGEEVAILLNKDNKNGNDVEIPSDTDNEEIPSDTDDEDNDVTTDSKIDKKVSNESPNTPRKRRLEDYENELSKSHKSFKTFRDTTIQKWNDKTRLTTAVNIKSTPSNSILQQISYILSDREKLVRRTQLKRSEYDIIGYKSPAKQEDKTSNNTELPMTKDRKDDDEYIPEIFDDSDFYHQLLRELIECKSADISDPVQLSRQWIALQQMRSKMKRKVDTKATKGRKIKYVVHKQLVNFMAPEKSTTWTDESSNELYSSLFGKMFENNNVGLNANLENGFKINN